MEWRIRETDQQRAHAEPAYTGDPGRPSIRPGLSVNVNDTTPRPLANAISMCPPSWATVTKEAPRPPVSATSSKTPKPIPNAMGCPITGMLYGNFPPWSAHYRIGEE